MPNMSDRDPASLSSASSPPGTASGAFGIRTEASIPRRVNSSFGCSSSITPKDTGPRTHACTNPPSPGRNRKNATLPARGTRPPDRTGFPAAPGRGSPSASQSRNRYAPAHPRTQPASASSSGGAACTRTSYKCSPITSASMRPGAAFTSRTQP